MMANPSFVAREAERMARDAAPFNAMLYNHLALFCMVMLAFPAAAQAINAGKELLGIDRRGHIPDRRR